MAADPSRTYGSITLAGQASAQGTLRISATGFAWKGREQTGRVVSITTGELDSVKWLRGGRGQQIRVARKGGSYVMFEGFRASDLTELRDFLNQVVGVELTNATQAVRGWSWGQLDVTSGMAASLVFRAGGGDFEKHNAKALEDAFDLPLGRVSNVQLPNPNEIAVDLHVDDTAGKMDEELVEVRFFVPDEVKAEDVHDRIKERADTSAFAGESICSFNQMGVIVPRGRYDIDLFPNHIKLRGKTVDFKILYSSITRLFLLPKPDNILVSFVMSLDPPVRQGNTMYPHIVFSFDTEDKSAVALHMDEDVLKDKYKGKLSKNEEGYTWRVFSKVVKNLSATPLHVPKTFRTTRNASAVRTALGPNEGNLFFLESCCFFVNKPPTYIRYDDIDFVDFRRMELERRFDLFVSLSTSNTTYTFTNIERNEFEIIFKFLHDSKNVPVENAETLKRTGGRTRATLVDDNDDSESDDDDFDPNAKPGDSNRKRRNSGDASDGSGGDSSGSESDDDDDAYVALEDDELDHVKENKNLTKSKKRAK